MLLIYYYFRFIKHAYTLNYNKVQKVKSIDKISYELCAIIIYFSIISLFILFNVNFIIYMIQIIVISMLYCF